MGMEKPQPGNMTVTQVVDHLTRTPRKTKEELSVDFEVNLLSYLMDVSRPSAWLSLNFFEDQEIWKGRFAAQQRKIENTIIVYPFPGISMMQAIGQKPTTLVWPKRLQFGSELMRRRGCLQSVSPQLRVMLAQDPLQLWNFSFAPETRRWLLHVPHNTLDIEHMRFGQLEMLLAIWLFGSDGQELLRPRIDDGTLFIISTLWLAKMLQVHGPCELYEDALNMRLFKACVCWSNKPRDRTVYLPLRLAFYTILISHLAFPDNYGNGDLLRERAGASIHVAIWMLREYGHFRNVSDRFWPAITYVVDKLEMNRYLLAKGEHRTQVSDWIYRHSRTAIMSLPGNLLAFNKLELSQLLNEIDAKVQREKFEAKWFDWPDLFHNRTLDEI